ncbi:hypothetical protein GUJ93_ZPchr0006g44447 [Zizania palustris]|uniref:CASP-like protein n=1 Tax=Zizania palustris TaxID=103762 RepID=A0A8J5SW05_ZIZPA|nr:hypothetical protein GUJ93_ZPchr0006g44447 [Zizania palustris]
MRSGGSSSEAAAAASGGTTGEEKAVAPPFRLAEVALRLCVVPLAVASLWEMATNKQVDETYGEVAFSDISGFRYLICINATTAAYSVASILMSSFKFITRFDWLIFLLDQVYTKPRFSLVRFIHIKLLAKWVLAYSNQINQ